MPEIKGYTRKCKNWLTSFKEWTFDRGEAPEHLIFWTALFCLSSAVRRKIYISKKYLGSWTCYPHCYIIIVGPAGMRKTTTMGYAIELLDQIPTLPKASTFVTQTALLDSILKSDDSSVYLTVEEFGDVILKGGKEMFEFLTSMYDAKKNIEQKTMARGIEFAEKPCINMLAATTPEWIAANMPESVIGGGFASRVIFLYVPELRRRKLFYKDVVKDFTQLEKDLVSDLAHISLNLQGEFTIEESALDYLEKWYQESDKSPPKVKKLAGYINRKPTHILKIAQLIHISYSDELIITKSDMEAAKDIVESIEHNLPVVFEGVGKNTYSLDMRDMVKFVEENPGIRSDELMQAFSNVAEPNTLHNLINGMLIMSLVRSEYGEDNKQHFYPFKEK